MAAELPESVGAAMTPEPLKDEAAAMAAELPIAEPPEPMRADL